MSNQATVLWIISLLLPGFSSGQEGLSKECNDWSSSGPEELAARCPFAIGSACNCSGISLPVMPRTELLPQGCETLDFSGNHLKCVPPINNTLSSCSNASTHCVGCIIELNLRQNKIESFANNAFSNLSICLKKLDLSENSIQHSSFHGVISGLNKLQYLDLHGNPLGTLNDNVFQFTAMPHLKILNLSSCELAGVENSPLDSLSELETLDLSNNLLHSLDNQMFINLKRLKVLNLRTNRITSIENNTFADLICLETLYLNDNLLTFLNPEAFDLDSRLSSLFLQMNRFSRIPFEALQKMTNLTIVNLSYNFFATLESIDHVGSTIAVKELILDYEDNLTSVQGHAFTAFQNLNTLSLRFCKQLEQLDETAFQAIASLQNVYLDHNNLKVISANALSWQQLTVLTLNDNPWICDCSMDWGAGHQIANTTFSCQDPLNLRGQMLSNLKPNDLSCPRSLSTTMIIVTIALLITFLAIVFIILGQRRHSCVCFIGHSLPCACFGVMGERYISLFTKDPLDLSSGKGDDLDQGQVTIYTDDPDRSGIRAFTDDPEQSEVKVFRDDPEGKANGEVEDLYQPREARPLRRGWMQVLLGRLTLGYRRLNTQDSDGSTLDLTHQA